MSATQSGVTYDLRLNAPALDADLGQAEARITSSVQKMNALRVVIPVSLDLSAFNAQAAQVNSTLAGWQNGITVGGAGGGNTYNSATLNNLSLTQNNLTAIQQNNQAIDYTVPDNTILIENPVAVTETSEHPTEAKAFVDFLYSDTAQKIFSDNGYRPVVKSDETRDFPQPSGLFDITKFGGWDAVMTKFFDPDNGIVGKIEQGLGVPTSK